MRYDVTGATRIRILQILCLRKGFILKSLREVKG